MEGSEDFKVENGLKDGIDDSGKVAVEVVDSGQVIELPSGPEAVEVVREGVEVENSGSPAVTAVEKEVESLNLVSGYEQQVEEAVVTSDIPVSDLTNVVASSSRVAGSVGEELDVDSSVPAGDATVDAGIPQVSEIPRSTEHQPPTTLTHQTRTPWTSCCGLFDALRSSN